MAGKHKIGARAGKYKLGTRARKYKSWAGPVNMNWGPRPGGGTAAKAVAGPGAKQKVRGWELQRPKYLQNGMIF